MSYDAVLTTLGGGFYASGVDWLRCVKLVGLLHILIGKVISTRLCHGKDQHPWPHLTDVLCLAECPSLLL